MDEFRGHTEALVIRQNSTKSNIHLKFSVANFLLNFFLKGRDQNLGTYTTQLENLQLQYPQYIMRAGSIIQFQVNSRRLLRFCTVLRQRMA